MPCPGTRRGLHLSSTYGSIHIQRSGRLPTNRTFTVVRSTAKLQKLLRERGVSDNTVSTHLTIIEGNVKDPAAVTETETVQREPGHPVDIIISGVGGTPTFTPNPLRPGLDDPTICQDATATLLSALRLLSSLARPLLVVISSTGISDAGRDFPLVMVPLYHWMLAVPHKDKKEMERMLVREMAHSGPEQPVIRGYIAVRPSLLTDGPRLSVEKIRVGTEDGNGAGAAAPAVGYTISRADVGGWIFDKVICEREGEREQWVGKMVSITY
ncbi:hypothetical protein MMC30_006683 [Trapelia coarctata]|nr:hypothetical protein [Trapelia coarctata]